MKFAALKKMSHLAAGTVVASTLTLGMAMPAFAMNSTAASQATQLSPSSQAWGGGGWWDDDFDGFPGGFNTDNSVHNCRTRMAPINNLGGGVVINRGNNTSC